MHGANGLISYDMIIIYTRPRAYMHVRMHKRRTNASKYTLINQKHTHTKSIPSKKLQRIIILSKKEREKCAYRKYNQISTEAFPGSDLLQHATLPVALHSQEIHVNFALFYITKTIKKI